MRAQELRQTLDEERKANSQLIDQTDHDRATIDDLEGRWGQPAALAAVEIGAAVAAAQHTCMHAEQAGGHVHKQHATAQ